MTLPDRRRLVGRSRIWKPCGSRPAASVRAGSESAQADGRCPTHMPTACAATAASPSRVSISAATLVGEGGGHHAGPGETMPLLISQAMRDMVSSLRVARSPRRRGSSARPRRRRHRRRDCSAFRPRNSAAGLGRAVAARPRRIRFESGMSRSSARRCRTHRGILDRGMVCALRLAARHCTTGLARLTARQPRRHLGAYDARCSGGRFRFTTPIAAPAPGRLNASALAAGRRLDARRRRGTREALAALLACGGRTCPSNSGNWARPRLTSRRGCAH